MAMKSQNVENIHFQLRSKAVLHSDEKDLYELSQLAGITMDPQIFKIILDLLKLNVAPVALASTLHSMCASGQGSKSFTDVTHSGSSLSHSQSRQEKQKKIDHRSDRTSLQNTSSSVVSEDGRKSHTSSRMHVTSRNLRNNGKTESSQGHLDADQTEANRSNVSRTRGSSYSGSSSRHRVYNPSSYRH